MTHTEVLDWLFPDRIARREYLGLLADRRTQLRQQRQARQQTAAVAAVPLVDGVMFLEPLWCALPHHATHTAHEETEDRAPCGSCASC